MSKAKKSKRFVYQLDSLLKVREIRETQAKDAYSEAEKHYQAELKKERDLLDERVANFVALRELMSEGALDKMQHILMRKAHIEVLKEKIEAQQKVREEAEKKVEEAREKLAAAMKEKKIIEKDKEKTREAWRKLMDKEEGKFLDEIATIGFTRRKRKKVEEEGRG